MSRGSFPRVHGQPVGKADCVDLGDGRLLIGEIYVNPGPPPMNMLEKLKRWWRRDPPASCRGQGIGSMLLEKVLTAAREQGFELAYGTLTKGDIARNPFLADWYRRHGFELLEADGDCAGDPAFKLVFHFRKPDRPKTVLAVYRHVEGDEEGNRQRRKEAFSRMMKEVADDHQADSEPQA